MKKILLLAVCVICSMATYSQEKIFGDINSQYDGWSDNCFNRLYPTAKTLVVVDGVSVKSEIGFDYRYLVNLDTTDTPVKYPMWVHGVGKANDSVYVESPDVFDDDKGKGYLMVGSMKCKYMEVYRYEKEDYTLVTLDELRRKIYPDVKGDFLYMINKLFIMTDADYYKLDLDFIQHVELVNSKNIDVLKNRKPFHILRIFTKNMHNLSVRDSEWYDPLR